MNTLLFGRLPAPGASVAMVVPGAEARVWEAADRLAEAVPAPITWTAHRVRASNVHAALIEAGLDSDRRPEGHE